MNPNSSAPPPARAAVEQLQAYSAPLEGRRELLRLDFNENTIGCSPLVAQAVRNFSAEDISIYPEYEGLCEAVVQNLLETQCRSGLQPDQVGLFNGVDAAIHAVFQAYGDPGDRLLTTAPTFGYYAPCARMQGMVIEAIPYEGDAFAFPLQGIEAALRAQTPRLLLICNPNNPTGTRLPADQVIALAPKRSPDPLATECRWGCWDCKSKATVASAHARPLQSPATGTQKHHPRRGSPQSPSLASERKGRNTQMWGLW